MFHQCQIVEEDQTALRFLWRDLETKRSSDVYQMLVMIFGAASSSCTANYVLRKTADDNCDDPSFSPETIETVKRNFYMDDLLKSVRDEATATKLHQELTALPARGGFRLTKWSSSSWRSFRRSRTRRWLHHQLIWTSTTCQLNDPWVCYGTQKRIPLDSLSPHASQSCQNVAL